MLPRYRRRYGMAAGRRFDAALFRRLLRFGGPNGLQFLVEVAAFTLFILLVGRLGPLDMAATTLAFNVNAVAFVPMLGLGIGLSPWVGQQGGGGPPAVAARAAWTTMWMAWAYMGTMAALYVLVPDLFLWGHASGTPPERFYELRGITVVLLRFVAAYCLLDAMNVVFCSVLKGAGDTRFILWTNLLTAFPLVAVVWIGISRFGGGLIWCWIMVTLWICGLGCIYLLRYLQGRWRTMRVIEPEVVDEDEVESHAVQPMTV
jgi:MATE family multidrug resistance protein